LETKLLFRGSDLEGRCHGVSIVADCRATWPSTYWYFSFLLAAAVHVRPGPCTAVWLIGLSAVNSTQVLLSVRWPHCTVNGQKSVSPLKSQWNTVTRRCLRWSPVFTPKSSPNGPSAQRTLSHRPACYESSTAQTAQYTN